MAQLLHPARPPVPRPAPVGRKAMPAVRHTREDESDGDDDDDDDDDDEAADENGEDDDEDDDETAAELLALAELRGTAPAPVMDPVCTRTHACASGWPWQGLMGGVGRGRRR
jgi:hypothetical protein